MPGLVNGTKRSLDQLEDEESSDTASLLSDDGFGSTSKRVRSNHHVPGSPDRPLLPTSFRADNTAQQKHQPGSLVRVALTDFVTYKKAEFLLGPSLNMIIGPNGTGKSTLVCAICLGLGWKTEHLGRAKDVSEFVRHGASEAEVEIELARDPHRHEANQVVKLVIKKSTNKSSFFLNGRPAPRKTVLEMCHSFSIQVDNLCQFLPQDRVVEFAALNPVDLLAQTLRAAAPQDMTDMHDQLKELHADHKRATTDHASLSTQLQQLESRQTMQRSDVERLQQRTKLLDEIRALELFLPTLEYRVAKAKFDDAKVRKQAAVSALSELEAQVEPALRAVNDQIAYRAEIQAVVEKRKKLVVRSEQNATHLRAVQTEHSDAIKEITSEIAAEQSRAAKLKTDKSRLVAKLRTIEAQMRQPRPDFDAADYNGKLRALKEDMRLQREGLDEANDQQTNCVREARQRNDRIARLKKESEALQTQAGQQEIKFKLASKDSYDAWQWIKANRDKFQGPIYGPPMISCSMKDKLHAIYAENALGRSEMLAFVVTDGNDFKKLNDQLVGQMRLKDITLRTSKMAASHWKPSLPQDELHKYGLDSYVLDLIDGPDAVLSSLCEARRIHEIGVSSRILSDREYEAISSTTIKSFMTPKEQFTITRRREYGDHAVSARTRRMAPPSVFTDEQVDTTANAELQDTIRELMEEVKELTSKAKEHNEVSKQLGERLEELSTAHDELQTEKNEKQQALTKYDALPTQLRLEEDKIRTTSASVNEVVGLVKERTEKINERNFAKAKDASMFATNIQALQRSHVELFDAELILIEAESDVESLQTKNAEVNNMLDARRKEVDEIKLSLSKLRDEAKALLAKVHEIQEHLTEQDLAIHDALPPDQTVQGLSNEIETRQAQLEMVHEGNPNVLREFEERARKIEKLQERVTQVSAEMSEYSGNIDEIRGRWEPELDALIRKISDAFGDNFQRIGCAGQIEVFKADDFADWSIQVQVKFRENEQLSILDSHRQSGGERAVSTIFYLMALQSLARAPFRVVDEINQGMDPRNERLVHSRMVSIACAEQTSQYFLITPKLLQGLDYHPKMKIHCIASGEYMPDDHRQLDFERLAQYALTVSRRLSGRV